MGNLDYHHADLFIAHSVNDPIDSLAKAVAFRSREFFATRGPWV
jgi:hypothetical protein